MDTFAVCQVTGVEFGRLHYWRRTGLVSPSGFCGGQGQRHEWSLRDVVQVETIKRLRECGAVLPQTELDISSFSPKI